MVGLKNWNKPSREEIAEMRSHDMSWRDIADQFGVHKTTMAKYAQEIGVPPGAMKNKRYKGTGEEIRRLIEEFGYDDQDIAGHFGISEAAASKRRLRAGILFGRSNPDGGKKTPEQLDRIRGLLDDGLSFTAIREITGARWDTLVRHFPGRQYTPEQSREAASLGQRARHLYAKLDREAA